MRASKFNVFLSKKLLSEGCFAFQNKCAQYWPSEERETEIFDDFVVKIKGEENCPDYVIRRLSLMNVSRLLHVLFEFK